jgi:hypothetical protein
MKTSFDQIATNKPAFAIKHKNKVLYENASGTTQMAGKRRSDMSELVASDLQRCL